MKLDICVGFSSFHVFALAICTYIAALSIETISGTAWVCSATGLAMGVYAMAHKRFLLGCAGFLTPILAIVLFILEAFILNLGPRRAALPFGIIFIINQVITTLITLIQLSILNEPSKTRTKQITIRTLLVAITSFAVFFAVTKHLLKREHNWLMATALGLLGLTFVGLSLVVYSAFTNRKNKLDVAATDS